MMTLKNITPEVDFDLPCLDDMCDGYGCDIHSDYARLGCDSVGCDSTVSTYLVELDGKELSVCNWHYHSLKENN
jgi:hypothetical protein